MVELVRCTEPMQEFGDGILSYYEHFSDVKPEEMDLLRQTAARFAFGRELTSEDLVTVAMAREKFVVEHASQDLSDLSCRIEGTSSGLLFEIYGTKPIRAARLGYNLQEDGEVIIDYEYTLFD